MSDSSHGSPLSPAVAPKAAANLRAAPTRLQLFLTFARIALMGFGGVLAWSRRTLVQEKLWLTAEEFTELYAVCNILPGGNIINFCVAYGARIAGLTGALAALAGLMTPPIVLMLIAGSLYTRFGALPGLRGALAGLAAAAAGLILATAVQMAEPLAKGRPRTGHIVALASFLAVGVLRWPLLPVLAVMVPVSIACAWWERQ